MAAFLMPVFFGAPPAAAGDAIHEEFIKKVAEDIAELKEAYPQLQEFSPAGNADVAQLTISYDYHTHRAAPTGGWTSGVPNPDPDGIWFHIDLHDPDSQAELHTQPAMIGDYDLVGNKRVFFLSLEGSATKSVQGAIRAILKRHAAPDPAPKK